MTSLVIVNRKRLMVAGSLLLLLSAVAVALNIRTINQRAKDDARQEALKQVNAAPDQLLRIVGNDDCPLRIVEARVKEVPAALFTELTGRTTELTSVSTLPDVTFVNTSGRTITGFTLMVRDPNTRKIRGVMQHALKIQPGATYMISRDLFIAPDKITFGDAQGHTEQRLVHPGLSSEKGWADFAPRTDLFVTVFAVNFDNAASWQLKEGGEVR